MIWRSLRRQTNSECSPNTPPGSTRPRRSTIAHCESSQRAEASTISRRRRYGTTWVASSTPGGTTWVASSTPGGAPLAEPAARRAVEIRTQALGNDHPAVAADGAALAAIPDALGRHDEAEALLRRAFEVFTGLLGPIHYEVGVNANNLAAVCYRRADHQQARALWEQALEIKSELLGQTTQNSLPRPSTLASSPPTSDSTTARARSPSEPYTY